MKQYVLEEIATELNFNEVAYLSANPDVAAAVKAGTIKSGRTHFDIFGKDEARKLRWDTSIIAEAKKAKLAKIKPCLNTDMPCIETEMYCDFLTDNLRQKFNIVDTDAVSSNNYDRHVLELIETYQNGLLLDCGAGRRSVYYENVVNFEIAPYETTDVRGVAEVLPFRDNSFDGVISIAVLEHVKDPFRCAAEITRVLKPGGQLICAVPFLQPLHAYPHHYYNMSHQGLKNLFEQKLNVDHIEVPASLLPIWSLTWIVHSWMTGLTGEAREEFLSLKLRDLIEPAQTFLNRSFVTTLPPDKNFELASGCLLFAHKPK
jgi:SAM-dependent methyltransferase